MVFWKHEERPKGLVEIGYAEGNPQAESSASIIIVGPTHATPPSRDWGVAQALQGDDALESWRDLHVFAYHFADRTDMTRKWDALAAGSDGLLQSLKSKLPGTVNILVGYSLGGIVIKSALNFADQHRQKYGPLLKSIIGMVFLGTPAGRNTMTSSELGGILHDLSNMVSPLSIDGQPRRDKEFLGKRVHDISFKFEQKWLSAATDVLSVSDKTVTRSRAETFLHQEQFHDTTEKHHSLLKEEMKKKNGQVRDFLRRLLNQPKKGKKQEQSKQEAGSSSRNDTENRSSSHILSRPSSPTPNSSLSYASTLRSLDPSPEKLLLTCILPTRGSPPPSLVGRVAEREALNKHLAHAPDEPQSLRIYVLHGPSGVGKTALAEVCFWDLLPGQSAAFWVDASDTSRLAAQFAEIARTVDCVDESRRLDDTACTEAALNWFEAVNSPWLLVLDGADDVDVLRDFLPRADSGAIGRILVTSRSTEVKNQFQSVSLDGIQGDILSPLSPLSEHQAMQLLVRETGDETPLLTIKPAALSAARELGGRPLVLMSVASRLKPEKQSLRVYMETHFARPPPWWQQPRPCYLVDLSNLPRDAQHLLQFLSMLGPSPIAKRTLQSWLQSWNVDEAALDDAILALSSLDGFTFSTDKQELSLELAVGHEVSARLTAEQWASNLAMALAVFVQRWPTPDSIEKRDEPEAGRWPSCEALFPFVSHLRKLGGSDGRSRIMAAVTDQSRLLVIAQLFQDVGRYAHERGREDEALAFAVDALVLFEAADTASSSSAAAQAVLCAIHETLADVAWAQGDPDRCMEAAQCVFKLHEARRQRQRREARQSLPPDTGLAWAHHQLAAAHLLNSNVSDALHHAESCHGILQGLGRDAASGLTAVDRLAVPAMVLALAYAGNERLEEAERVVRAVVDGRLSALGADHVSFKSGLLNLILFEILSLQLHRKSLPWEEAEHPLRKEAEAGSRQALRHLEQTVGRNHPWVATTLLKTVQNYLVGTEEYEKKL